MIGSDGRDRGNIFFFISFSFSLGYTGNVAFTKRPFAREAFGS